MAPRFGTYSQPETIFKRLNVRLVFKLLFVQKLQFAAIIVVCAESVRLSNGDL